MEIEQPSHGNEEKSSQDTFLRDSGYEAFEKDVLMIARLFFMTFTKPQSHSWIDAFEGASVRFGPPFGATIAMAVADVIRSLGQCRTTPFQFINPRCKNCRQRISEEERYLLSAFQATRQNKRSEATAFAMLVCEGNDAGKVIAALKRLSLLFGQGPLAR